MPPRWSRVLRMSPREMLHRGKEAFDGFRERTHAGREPAPALPLPPDELLRQFCGRPFFAFDGAENAAMRDAFSKLFPGAADRIVARADAICRGEFRLYAQDVAFPGGIIDWHRDWKTGGAYPRHFYREIEWSPEGSALSSKRVLELNRHQFLVTLGQAHLLTGKDSYAEEALALLDSWLDENPPFLGVNWKDALELALRLLSWLWTLRLIHGSKALDERARARIVASIALQRDHIERHNSLYSSPNTHLLGEALALYAAGLMLPELPGARRGAAWAHGVLETELHRQVRDDGSHAEQSAYYHAYALEMYLLATALGRQHGQKFSGDWIPRVEKMAEFLMALTRPDGMLARFGDDDGGRTLRLSAEDYYDARPLLAVAAAVFGREDFRFVAGDNAEDVFWLLGPAAAERFLQMPSRAPARRSFYFPEAHVGVIRTGWGPQDAWVVCQAQPMGMLTAGHSHANILGVEISLAGQNVVADPGTFCYADDLARRDHFRGIAAHSAAEISGARLPIAADCFRWANSDAVRPSSENRAEDALMRMGCELTADTGTIEHTRTIVLDSPHILRLEDEIRGHGRHRIVTRFQFAPGVQIEPAGNEMLRVRLGDTAIQVWLGGFQNPRIQIREGSKEPKAGWVSPSFDNCVAVPMLEIIEDTDLPARRTVQLLVEDGTPGEN